MVTFDDLKDMSIGALQNLITSAQDLLNQYEKDKKKAVIKELQALAASANLNIEIKEGGRVASAPLPKGAPKYRNPDNPKQTWTGRGKRPTWLNEALEAGKKLEDFLI